MSKEVIEQELFWNRIMGEHAKFIRGLLDPSEEALLEAANKFGKEFEKLSKETLETMEKETTTTIQTITYESMRSTQNIQNFKTAGTEGILNCKVKSVILPLLSDHVLRESNHYLRLLKNYTGSMPKDKLI
jgi:hypothetical protein